MPGVVLAWLAGEGIIIYRSYHTDHRPPMPGQLLGSSMLYLALGLIGRAPNASFLAGAMAWGFTIAAFMQTPVPLADLLYGKGAPAPKAAATKKTATPAKGAKTG
jgi:hypothetical protein